LLSVVAPSDCLAQVGNCKVQWDTPTYAAPRNGACGRETGTLGIGKLVFSGPIARCTLPYGGTLDMTHVRQRGPTGVVNPIGWVRIDSIAPNPPTTAVHRTAPRPKAHLRPALNP
jgi:hypothetical protein